MLLLGDQWEHNMGFLENLTNDAFANKMADHYHTHIGAAEFKHIRAEAEIGNVQTPLWLSQPFMQRGIQRGKDNPSGKINFITAPVIDTARITKFMGSPKGLLFIAKQVGLQLSNPKGEFLIPGPINAGRIYNPAATIAQIPAGALGIHIDRHNLGPLNIEATNYEKRIKAKTLLKSNRLLDIASQLKVGYFRELTLAPSESETANSDKTLIQKVADKIKNTNWYLNHSKGINAMSGLGGPNSFFGIGKTIHRTSKPGRIDSEIYIRYAPPPETVEVGNPGPNSYESLKPADGYNSESDKSDKFDPFIKNPPKAGSTENPLAKYQTLEYGGIVKAGKETSTATPIKSFRTDGGEGTRYETNTSAYARLGLIDYGKVEGGTDDSTDKYGEDNAGTNDFVTLKLIGTIDGKADESLRFRSYGLGSITDNTSFSWTEVKSAGRTMAQQKFDSVARDISHDLTIVAFTATELKQNYIRLNKLYQMASPTLSTDGLATAPFCKLTLGDLYDEVNVIIDKITFTVDDSTPWDIYNGDLTGQTAKAELPMIIKLNLGYKLLTNADGNFFSNSSRFWKTTF